MENRRSLEFAGRVLQLHAVPWEWLEQRTSSAFTLAGVLLLGSLVVPVGLKQITTWAWVSGLLLVGIAVVAVAAGLVGLYSTAHEHAPRLATVGVLCGVVAGIAALGLLAIAGIALIGTGVFGMDLGKPMGAFLAVTLVMAGGYGLGFLSFGVVGWRTDGVARPAGRLFLLGGAVLLVPVVRALLRRGFGIETGLPPWVFLPALGVIALDTLALGYSLRTAT